MASSIRHVVLGGACNQTCTVCDCRTSPSPVDAGGVPMAVRGGGDRLVLRGEAAVDPAFARTLEAAAGAGWGEVWLRTNGRLFATPEAAEALHARGVRGVIVPLFAHVSSVHDRVAGIPGSLVTALRAMRALAGVGMSVAIESPVLAPRLQDLAEVVRLAHRAVPSLAGARFYVPVRQQPAVLAPPRWNVARTALARAVDVCRELGVPTEFREIDAIPPCVLGHDEAHAPLHRLNPRKPVGERDGFAKGKVCETCTIRAYCAGISDAYRAAHGEADLVPFGQRPKRLLDQRTTPRREWTDRQREAASQEISRVLRPTVHCNQDCPFCSANETTENVFADPGEMLRRIARLARSGVRWISFSGGEPTLSKDLVHYIAAASRLGVRDIELVTNGVLIDSPAKVRPLRDAGLNRAFVSLHAHDELLARRTTSKTGDWERTVRAIGALVDAGVHVDINHVISAINYQYLPRFAEFVTDTWKGAVGISFAFVTPQFRALENIAIVPRISDVMPFLRRAMRTLVERRNRFVVGSRQGVPPCFLGEYAGWSDFVQMSAHSHADDEPQKARGPQCDACRFSPQCVGLWRPYAARYGFDELVPVLGPPLTADEIAALEAVWLPSVEGARHPALDLPPRHDFDIESTAPEPPSHHTSRHLPVIDSAPARTLKVAMLGSGRQSLRLANAMRQVRGLVLAGVSSPHVNERDPGPFAAVPRYSDSAELLDAVRPDAVIIASATIAHHALALLAASRGLPVLVEKPLARTPAQADELVALSERSLVMPAHAMAFSPGVRALCDALRETTSGRIVRAACIRRASASSPDAPAAWSRESLYETLLHSVSLLGAVVGGCDATVRRVEARGAHRPEMVRAELAFRDGIAGEIVLDFTVAAAVDEVLVVGEHGKRLAWKREGADESIEHDTPSGNRTSSVERGSDTEGMLEAFRDAVIRGTPPPVTARDARDAMAVAQAILDALAEHFVRSGAPRHVASPSLR